MERLEALETSITDLELNQQAPIAPGGRREVEQLRTQLREEMAALREDFRNLNTGPGGPDRRKGLFNSKDCLPEVLSNDYKQK